MKQTSIDARESISAGEISDLQLEILRLLTIQPMTDEELIRRIQEAHPERSDSSIRTRRSELLQAGHVIDNKTHQQSAKGRWMTVWAAAPVSPLRSAVKVETGMRPNSMPGRPDRFVNIERARDQAAQAAKEQGDADERARLKATPYLDRAPRVVFGQRLCRFCNATGGNKLDGPCFACHGAGVV